MKKIFLLSLLLAVTGLQISAQEAFQTDQEKFSYALGMLIAQNFRGQPLPDIDPELFGEGFSVAAKGEPGKLAPQNASLFVNQYMQEFQKKQAQADAEKYAANKTAGEEFLAKNAEKEGVMTTESGLQYEILTEGTGESPAARDTVTVHYEGTLITGEVFDSSVKRGQPASFPLNGVIKGWTEGLQLMKTGAKYRFYIPQDLAYGSRSTGPLIKPFSTLIFDVELISVGNK